MKNSINMLFLLLFLNGCITLTPKFNGEIYLHDVIPEEICRENPELVKVGIFRKLNDGSREWISYCNPMIMYYLSSHKDDVQISEKE